MVTARKGAAAESPTARSIPRSDTLFHQLAIEPIPFCSAAALAMVTATAPAGVGREGGGLCAVGQHPDHEEEHSGSGEDGEEEEVEAAAAVDVPDHEIDEQEQQLVRRHHLEQRHGSLGPLSLTQLW